MRVQLCTHELKASPIITRMTIVTINSISVNPTLRRIVCFLLRVTLEEEVGFEPTEAFTPSDFKSEALNQTQPLFQDVNYISTP